MAVRDPSQNQEVLTRREPSNQVESRKLYWLLEENKGIISHI